MSILYDLTGKRATLLNLAENGTVDPEVLQDTMDSLDGAIEEKTEGYVQVIKQIEADADVIGTEIKRLTDRRAAFLHNRDHIKQSLQECLEYAHLTRVKTPLFTVTIAKNGGKQPIDIDEDNLQADVFKEVRTPDTDLIRQRLDAGEEVVGATYKPRGNHLLIK
ncbi:siphovirus Gp157 family protein [Lacticaseibacillus mingshuiensis]|uniref:siphovirus Gp157 family protein n=1 Tax=Lacticaseibacillus mingshuiensis TaxID=2799574 RepID=UPI0019452412|nr:siphovirus Gp157 family protein [Lacticaseibacillus mingshuiensis]